MIPDKSGVNRDLAEWALRDDQHRAGGEADELLGDSAKQQAGRLAATAAAHNYHFG
jgi:hypothetical protein